MVGFLGTGMMVELLKHEGSSHSSRDLLNICVYIGASCEAQTLRQDGETLSGPAALRLCLRNTYNMHLFLTYDEGGDGSWRTRGVRWGSGEGRRRGSQGGDGGGR